MTPINAQDNQRIHGYSAPHRSEQKYTEADLRSALVAAAGESGGPLSRAKYQRYSDSNPGLPHSYTIIKRYGKWSTALKHHDLPVHSSVRLSSITNEDCLDALIEARNQLGHLPSTGEYTRIWAASLRSQGHPSASTIRSKYGTWRKAMVAAVRLIR